MSTATPVSAGPLTPHDDTWRTLGIVGFAFAFFPFANVVGLALCIVSLVGARRSNGRQRFAMWGLVISAIGVLIGGIVLAVTIATTVDVGRTCAELGTGVHVVGSATYTCTSTTSTVTWN